MEVVASTQAAALQMSAPVTNSESVTPNKATDALAEARFAELMQAPSSNDVASVQSLSGAPEVAASDRTATLGDRMLQGMERLSGDLKAAWGNVTGIMHSNQTLTAQDVLSVQMQLTRLAIEYELVGKVTSRTTQTIDQLERLQ